MGQFLIVSPSPDHAVRPAIDVATLPELIARTEGRLSGHIAIQWRENKELRQLTYSQVWTQVESLARALLANGMGPNDHLGIWSENRWEWVVAYLAILRIGAVAIPMDSLLKTHEVRHILRNAEVKLAFTSAKFSENLIQIVGEMPEPVTVVSFDSNQESQHFGTWVEQGASGSIPEKVRPTLDSLAVIIYTSGTTGFAKGVMLTHRNIASDISGCYQVIDFDVGDTFLSVLPLHHTFECTVGMLAPLAAGCTIHYASSLKSRELIEDFRLGKATIILGVPLLFEKLLAAIDRGIDSQSWHKRTILRAIREGVKVIKRTIGADLGSMAFRQLRARAGMGSVRLMVSGGAALPPKVAERYNELGFPLMQGYGLTETSPVLATNTKGHTKHSTVGKAIPGVTLKIDMPDAGGEGEIMAKGDPVMQGYYENEQATKQAFRDGWFATGDRGRLDEDGYLTITGRVKEIIVTGAGKNINPEEVEAELNKSPYVLESLVLGVPSKTGIGEDLGALIVPDYEEVDKRQESTGSALTQEDLERLIRDQVREICHSLPEYKHVKKVKMHMEEFQRTATGKIKRYLYREHFLPIPPPE
jgi:long-chain acyl-CoA synthetase